MWRHHSVATPPLAATGRVRSRRDDSAASIVIRFGTEWLFLTVAHHANAIRRDPGGYKGILRGIGPVLA